MAEINLLPSEKKPKASVLRLRKTLRKILTVLVIVFLTVTAMALIAFLFFSNKVKLARERYSETKRQIAALEQTEQRYFLLKDRLGKIEEIRKIDTAEEEIEVLSDVLVTMEGVAQLTNAELKENNAKVSVVITSSKDLSSFINDLVSEGDYKAIEVSSLDFKRDKGYETEFLLER